MNMKCVCGHEYIEEQDPDEPGNEKFIPLYVYVANNIRRPAVFVTEPVYLWEDRKEHQLFMCPECGTIRGERYFG